MTNCFELYLMAKTLRLILSILILAILLSHCTSHPKPDFLTAHTHYSNGLRLFQNDSLTEALDEYLNALKIMETSDSMNYHPRFMMLIHWQLGNLFSSQYMQEPAIICYENALKFNALGECVPFEKSTLLHELGYQYDKLQKYDTALYYYDEALSLMSDTSNISYQNLLFYIAMLDCTSGEDFDNGILKAKKLVSQTPEPYRDWRYVNIGLMYHGAGLNDSALVYLQKAFAYSTTDAMKSYVAEFIHDIYKSQGDTIKATKYEKFLVNNPSNERVSMARVSTLHDMFQKHQKWEQKRLQTIEHQRFIKYIIILSILIILPILLILLLKKKKPSPTNSFSSRFSLFEKSEIVTLIRERLSKNHDKMSVKNIDEQTELSLDNAGFVALRTAVDTHFDGLLKNLSTKYPDLNVNDLNCCCLAILGLSNTEMAVLLGVKYNSLTNRLAKIKKILSTEENLHDFLIKM